MENYSISSALRLSVAFCQTCKIHERFNYFAGLPVTMTQKKMTKAVAERSEKKKKNEKIQ